MSDPTDLAQPTTELDATPTETSAEPLGTAGIEALAKEREARKAAERRLKAIEQQLQGLDPEQLRNIKEAQEREERLRAEMDQRIKEAAEAAKAEAYAQVKVKDQKLNEVLAEKTELYRRQALANAFQLAGGRSGGADDGTTYFDALMGAVGARFKVGETGDVVVVNGSGEPMLTENGDPIAPATYLEQLKTHPVYGHFFAPSSNGHGGGMRGSGNLTSGSLQGMSAMEKISYGLSA
jgi:hypothetical protein